MKRIIGGICCFVLCLCCLAGCTINRYEVQEFKNKVEEMQNKMTELEKELSEESQTLKDKISELEECNQILQENIKRLNKELDDMKHEIECPLNPEFRTAFDTTDQKEPWDGSFSKGVQSHFESSLGSRRIELRITFMQIRDGESYPELELRHLDLEDIEQLNKMLLQMWEEINYLILIDPDRFTEERVASITAFRFSYSLFKPNNWTEEDGIFRQIAYLRLPLFLNTPEAFTCVIRHLENLCFIKSVRAQVFNSIDPIW